MGYIYIIKNDINDKVYIGKTTKTIQSRWMEHLESIYQTSTQHRPLYAAMRKHGYKHFYIEQLEEVDNSLLNEQEIYWIKRYDSYNNGYNATLGGDGRNMLVITKEEIIELFDKYPNRTLPFYSKQLKCSVPTLTKYIQLYNIYYDQNYNKGKIINNNKKPIQQLDLITHQIINTFESMYQAADELIQQGVTSAKRESIINNIRRVCIGERNKCYGYYWQYINI